MLAVPCASDLVDCVGVGEDVARCLPVGVWWHCEASQTLRAAAYGGDLQGQRRRPPGADRLLERVNDSDGSSPRALEQCGGQRPSAKPRRQRNRSASPMVDSSHNANKVNGLRRQVDFLGATGRYHLTDDRRSRAAACCKPTRSKALERLVDDSRASVPGCRRKPARSRPRKQAREFSGEGR